MSLHPYNKGNWLNADVNATAFRDNVTAAKLGESDVNR